MIHSVMSVNKMKVISNRKLRISGLIIMVFQFVQLFGTHNRAGEITFEQIGPLTIRATVTTYTMTSSVAADRDSIEIFWGDGSSSMVKRSNGWGDPQPNDVKINYYTATHTYSGRATYTISMYDPNRIAGILNVNYPDSANVPFYLETTFSFLNTQFLGDNNSVRLLAPPIDFGCVGQIFRHNPNAFDIEGDSISYTLIIPLQQSNSIVPDYRYPDQIAPGADNIFTLDPRTGDIVWNVPKVAGDYNFAFRVNEYRQGILISSTIRDMQILIRDQCQNRIPSIDVEDEICVYAGEKVNATVLFSDVDMGQMVQLTASGAPFISTKNKAVLSNKDIFLFPPATGIFEWETSCEDVSEQYYQVIFKVSDNGFSDTTGLTNLKSLRIKVVAPPPLNPSAEPAEDHMLLKWDYPYACAFAEDEYFRGFSVWRRLGSETLQLEKCTTGLGQSSYQKIVFLTREDDGIHYFYEDFDIEKEVNYCYRILPEFARKTKDGFPYNPVSGQPGMEVCNFIPSNAPLMTKVSVLETDGSAGKIELNWQLIGGETMDTLAFPGPYVIELSQSVNGTDFLPVAGARFTGEHFSELLNDTVFIHQMLNTASQQYEYSTRLYYSSDEILVGSSPKASSVFLSAEALQGKVRLQFETQVPWHNSEYAIYRKSENENEFVMIGYSQTNRFDDSDIENGKNYCYYAVSRGNYSFLPQKILVNNSQILCIDAVDFTPICGPALSVTNDCENAPDWAKAVDLYNYLEWTDEACPERTPEISGYYIYYGTDPENLEKIDSIDHNVIWEFKHHGTNGLQGCYSVTAVDASGNEGEMSNIVCAENCPVYVLPNVFTPDGDNVHDTFVPRYSRHIETFNIKIFNQWGQLVFETNDPEINWDGTNLHGKALASGVYFYVYQLTARPSPDDSQVTGIIHLFR